MTTLVNVLNEVVLALKDLIKTNKVTCNYPPLSTNVVTTSVVILPANSNRKGFIIFNNSANSTYVTFGPTSVASTCTRLIPTYASWEVTQGAVYTGAISAIRNSGTGIITVYELI